MQTDISVCIATYNPDIHKLLMTTISILQQTKVSFELIFADDGSAKDYSDIINCLMREWHFDNYVIVKNTSNLGTVLNIENSIKYSHGKYLKLISAGDFLYSDNVLSNLLDHIKTEKYQACFSEAVYYCYSDYRKLPRVLLFPQYINAFKRKDKCSQLIHYLVLNDRVCGATWLVETDVFKEYISAIVCKVKYSEDSVYRLMLLDGLDIGYANIKSVFYEMGSGISTSKSSKWTHLLELDDASTDKLLIEKCKNKTDFFSRRYSLFLNRTSIGTRFKNDFYKVLFFPESVPMWLVTKFNKRINYENADFSFADKCNELAENFYSKHSHLVHKY